MMPAQTQNRVLQEHAAHHVHLPELHGSSPFPASVGGELLPHGLGLDQVMADQGPIDGHVRGDVLLPFPLQLVDQPDGSPPRVLAAHLEDAGLDHRGDLVGTGLRTMGLLGQGLQSTLLIAFQPRIDALSAHVIGLGHLGDGEAISYDA
jgi:hypothetical protein